MGGGGMMCVHQQHFKSFGLTTRIHSTHTECSAAAPFRSGLKAWLVFSVEQPLTQLLWLVFFCLNYCGFPHSRFLASCDGVQQLSWLSPPCFPFCFLYSWEFLPLHPKSARALLSRVYLVLVWIKSWKYVFLNVRIDQNVKIIKILVHLTGNFNAPDNDGRTPIHEVESNGNRYRNCQNFGPFDRQS